MIASFKSKALRTLWETGRSSGIDARMHKRARIILDIIDGAKTIDACNVPGLDFHPLRGFKPTRYTVHLNGPWCITFEFAEGDALRLDFEQYH